MLYLFLFLGVLAAFLTVVQVGIVRQISIFNRINLVICFVAFYLIIVCATFNNDWIAYQSLFDGQKPTNDLLYAIGFRLFASIGYSFENFYFVNQIFISLALLYFISRFVPKYIFLVTLSILFIAAPNLSILLRYYNAFVLFLIAIYFFNKDKKYISYFLFFMSIISHFGIIILILFVVVKNKIKVKSNIKNIAIIATVLWLVKDFLFLVLTALGIGSFVIYIEEEKSSFVGGIFAMTPYLPWVVFVLMRHKHLVKTQIETLETDKTYMLLFRLSSFSFLFLVMAIFTQIIMHRYVEPFVIVWSMYLCYTIKFQKSTFSTYLFLFKFLIVLFLSFYLKYIFPIQFNGISEWTIHYLEILLSNKYKIFEDFLL